MVSQPPTVSLRCSQEQEAGAASAEPDFSLIAWNLAWEHYGKENALETITNLPKNISPMAVSEEAVEKNIGGIDTFVRDYSISMEGPGEYARRIWDHAHKTGHKAYAKLQLGNTWEMATTACVPAFEKIYRHLCRVAGECSVDGVMLGWTLGGFPSMTLRLAQIFYEKRDKLPTLDEIYAEMFPNEDIAAIKEAADGSMIVSSPCRFPSGRFFSTNVSMSRT